MFIINLLFSVIPMVIALLIVNYILKNGFEIKLKLLNIRNHIYLYIDRIKYRYQKYLDKRKVEKINKLIKKGGNY